jgi:diaminopimelate epimerase
MPSSRRVQRLRFTKMHGLGNDFVVVEDGPRLSPAGVRRLSDRRRGIGADGVLSILPSRVPGAAARMLVQNADGSVAEMCGNGLRCVVRRLLAAHAVGAITIDTDAGLRRGLGLGDGRIRVSLGTARLLAPRSAIDAQDSRRFGIGISMGNPHLVLDAFPAGADLRQEAARLGPELERHPAFPHGTNVEFFAVEGERTLRLVVFERGAGITDACGTGASATAAAARRAGLVAPEGPILVRLPGGELEVDVQPGAAGDDADLGEVSIVGEALAVFSGEIELEAEDLAAPGEVS